MPLNTAAAMQANDARLHIKHERVINGPMDSLTA